MTPSIPTKLQFGEHMTAAISDSVLSLLKSVGVDAGRRTRLEQVQEILQDLSWTNGYTLELQDWPDKRLWDLWGLIPSFYVRGRKKLARYLERSPLIKLAECAE